MLQGHTDQYVMISTVSVYDPAGPSRRSTRTRRCSSTGLAIRWRLRRSSSGRTRITSMVPCKNGFGARDVEAVRRDRATIIRPAWIVGPGSLPRSAYLWPWRIEQGGEIIAPGDGTATRSRHRRARTGGWTVRMVENHTTGTLQRHRSARPPPMAGMLARHSRAFPGNHEVDFRWITVGVPEGAGSSRPVAGADHLIPADDPESVISRTRIDRALATGRHLPPPGRDRVLASVESGEARLAPDVQARVTRAAGLPAEKEKGCWRRGTPAAPGLTRPAQRGEARRGPAARPIQLSAPASRRYRMRSVTGSARTGMAHQESPDTAHRRPAPPRSRRPVRWQPGRNQGLDDRVLMELHALSEWCDFQGRARRQGNSRTAPLRAPHVPAPRRPARQFTRPG